MSAQSHSSGKKSFDSLKALPATLGALVYTRLELILIDLELARERVATQLIWLLVALFCIGVGVVLLIILTVIVLWDTQRLLVLSSLTGLFLLGGFFVSRTALHKLRTRPPLFHASYAELTREAAPTSFYATGKNNSEAVQTETGT
ncbi:MAG: phage holin family protein [Sulfuriferula sp.]